MRLQYNIAAVRLDTGQNYILLAGRDFRLCEMCPPCGLCPATAVFSDISDYKIRFKTVWRPPEWKTSLAS